MTSSAGSKEGAVGRGNSLSKKDKEVCSGTGQSSFWL